MCFRQASLLFGAKTLFKSEGEFTIRNIIEFKNVSYEDEIYWGNSKKFILKNVNFEVKRGEFISIMGPNGCGKSTLAKHCNGLLTPTSGDVFVDGFNTKNEKTFFEVKKKVGMIFQNPEFQTITSTVEEEIAFGLENLCVSPSQMNSIIKNSLYYVGLEGMQKKATHQLSGGQKQRLAIASVLAMKPEIIVLDEPTSMLEPGGRKAIMNILKNLHINGVTIIIITHNISESLQSERVIFVDDGQIQFQGNPYNIFSDMQFIEKHKFQIPESTQILYYFKRRGFNVNLKAFKSKECANEIIKMSEKTL